MYILIRFLKGFVVLTVWSMDIAAARVNTFAKIFSGTALLYSGSTRNGQMGTVTLLLDLAAARD